MKKRFLSLLVLLTFLSACSTATIYNDGEYEGVAEGKYGPISVSVTIKNDKIKSVVVTSHSETPGISDPAIEEVTASIVKLNSTENVDLVSGATITSQAIIDATQSAIEKARK